MARCEEFKNDLLRELNKKLGLSKKDIALELNVSLKQINNYDNGTTEIPVVTKKYIKALFEVYRIKQVKNRPVYSFLEISARRLKKGDIIFDLKHKIGERIDYIGFDDGNGLHEIDNVHISYGLEKDRADNFKPDDRVIILIDTSDIFIEEPNMPQRHFLG